MYHVPVLLEEAVEGLGIVPGGVYVDLTFGGGGHSREILRRMEGGRLIGFDQDADAAANVPADGRFTFVNHNFKYVRNFLRYEGVEAADGVLADLGVSWHEFDEAERGFSFRFDAELDMRMSRRGGMTAADVVNGYEEEELARLFREYGELENARRLAAAVVAVRPLRRTGELVEAVAGCVPRTGEKRYLARVFQALRMEVNGELEALAEMLEGAVEVLRPGGRLVVITYHSLEDRMVKNFLRTGNVEGREVKDFYGRVERRVEAVTRRVVVPSAEEVARNPRARSAKLRIGVKLK